MKAFLRHLKKIVAAGVFAFIAFAPPGTLILIAAVLLGVLGKTYFVAFLVAAIVLSALCAYIFRSRIYENRFVKTILGKLSARREKFAAKTPEK